jgi:hypothetical protein
VARRLETLALPPSLCRPNTAERITPMAPLPPLPLFPPPPSLKFAQDTKLQAAVKAAVDALAAARGGAAPAFRVAIIDLGDEKPGSTLNFGAYNGDTVDFIASEAKIIALYAAFALRDLVERFAVGLALRTLIATGVQAFGGRKAPPSPDLFTALRTELDTHIIAAADGAIGALPRGELLPDYKTMFVVPPGGKPDFKPSFRGAMRQMIVPSSNSGASTVIMSVGYAYISGAMKAADLFVGGKGPWLSADFAGHYHALIQSTNDSAVGQAGTALSMAKLMSILMTGGITIRADSFTEMQKLLADAVDGPDTPLLTRDPSQGFTDPADTDRTKARLRLLRNTELTHIKLGQEWLKPKNGGHMVWSEVFRLKDLYKAGKTYAVSYQNLLTGFVRPPDMAFVIRNAIQTYEA